MLGQSAVAGVDDVNGAELQFKAGIHPETTPSQRVELGRFMDTPARLDV